MIQQKSIYLKSLKSEERNLVGLSVEEITEVFGRKNFTFGHNVQGVLRKT